MDLLEDIGSVSDELKARLREQRNLETLRKWLKLAAHARSIEEFEGLVFQSVEEAKVSMENRAEG